MREIGRRKFMSRAGVGVFGGGVLLNACASEEKASVLEDAIVETVAAINDAPGAWYGELIGKMDAYYIGKSFTDVMGVEHTFDAMSVGKGGASYMHRPAVSWSGQGFMKDAEIISKNEICIRTGHPLEAGHHIIGYDLWAFILGMTGPDDVPALEERTPANQVDALGTLAYCFEATFDATGLEAMTAFVPVTICNTDGIFYGSPVLYPNAIAALVVV